MTSRADWLLPVCEGDNPAAILTSAGAKISDDEGFTSRHIAFTVDMNYPSAFVGLRFVVCVYPVGPRDIYIQANTWGRSQGRLEHREAASEKNVLTEIDSCADLGIDVLQIDDGWQGDGYDSWKPAPQRYPAGWERVRARAEERGVKLGLWMAAMPPGLEDLIRNAESTGRFMLPGLAGRDLALTDLLNGHSWNDSMKEDGAIEFGLPEPGSFLFLEFQVD